MNKPDSADLPVREDTYVTRPDQAQAQRMAWWRDARFGMFIHWGLYAVLAGEWQGKHIPGLGEWIMYRANIPAVDYERLAGQFNPARFDAEAWVKLARDAGMKYLVITAKHHEGFAMFKSASSYNIVAATTFGRDPIEELADACLKYGVRLCFYYSQDGDWHAPGGNTYWEGVDAAGRPGAADPQRFACYLEETVKPQLRELLTNYGPVGLIWFDNPMAITREQSLDLCNLVHQLQPDCLVSGRIGHDCGDYGSLGDNQLPAGHVQGDWETPATMNDTWGYKHYDHNWKSAQYLLRLLVQCAAKGVNYLLNVGPTGEGVIPEPSVERLQVVGQWLKANGESIYGTRQSPFPCDFPWGHASCKPGHVYLHFLQWPGPSFALAGLRSRVEGVRLLADRRIPVPFNQEHDATSGYHVLRLQLPTKAPDPHVSVVAVDLAGELDVDPLPVQQPDGSLALPAHLAMLDGPPCMHIESGGYVDGWDDTTGRLTWSFRLFEPGRYRAYVRTYLDRDRDQAFRPQEGRDSYYGNHRMRVAVGDRTVAGVVGRKDMIPDESVNHWHTAESDVGVIDLARAGEETLSLILERRDAAAERGPTVCGVRLAPAG